MVTVLLTGVTAGEHCWCGRGGLGSDGRRLVTAGEAGSVVVCDARTFAHLRTLGAPPGASSALPGQNTGVSGADVFRLAVSPDDRLIAAVRLDGSVRVWDMATGHDAFTVDAGPALAPFMAVSWSRDGNLLAVAANDGRTGRATIVDRTGLVVAVRQEEIGVALAGVFFTPDGGHIFTTRLPTEPPNEGRGEIVTWNWHDGGIEQILDVPATMAYPSPTGDLVATLAPPTANGQSDTVELWDPATARRVAALEGSAGSVLDVAFSPDGTGLATGAIDGLVTIWDVASGEQLLVLRGHYTFVASVAFSPDGSQLASVGAEGVVRIWALDLDDLVEIAEREVTRTLTDAECRQYLHLTQCP